MTTPALQTINSQVKRKNQIAKTIIEQLENTILPYLKEHVEAQSTLEKAFNEYLTLLSKYQDGRTIAPLDAFPGIRTTDSLYNSKAMQNDSSRMKYLADVVNDKGVTVETNEHYLATDSKKFVSLLSDYLETSSNIKEAFYELLEKLDSVYDAGMLAKNS